MKRRTLLENLGALVGTGAAAALVPSQQKIDRGALPTLSGQRVHWVSPDRRHIEAVLVHRYKDGSADLLIEERPAEGAGRFLQTHPRVPYCANVLALSEGAPYNGPSPHTWHEPEPFGTMRAPKPYAMWWFKRPAGEGDRLAPRPEPGWREGDQVPTIHIAKAKDGVLTHSARYDPDDERAA